MRTDRELLELAAKAADMKLGQYADGWHWVNDGPRGAGIYKIDPNQSPVGNPRFRFIFWNPLTDDGDALRLAVKLEMQVCIGVRRIDATIVGDEDGQVFRGTEAKVGDVCAATRRAIVLAAAEIGAQAHPKQHNDGADRE